jgi:hypothetical protein
MNTRGKNGSMCDPESCVQLSCTRPVVTSFCKEALCLDHFCSRSYEFLNRVEQRSQSDAMSSLATADELVVAEECARRTLDVCMSKMLLNNLERARLLDILLWCGDLIHSFAPRRDSVTGPEIRMRQQRRMYRWPTPASVSRQ